ncbi:NADH-dependent [FeFe] hydrogenase, group A6 [Thermincola ferriacetica]
MITLSIDGQKVEVEPGTSILEAARLNGIYIPTLCYLKELNEIGACRVCLVEIKGARTLQPSCTYPVAQGMEVFTHSPRVIKARKLVLELYLSNHPFECLTCVRNQRCELQSLAERYHVRHLKVHGELKRYPIDDQSPAMVREPSKCIVCRRCIRVCKDVQEIGIYQLVERGFDTVASPAFKKSLAETPCIYCGQCLQLCPTAAIHEKEDLEAVWRALADPEKHVVIQTAPSIRGTLGEGFGMPAGSLVTGKMVAALKKLGFAKVFDDCFGADIVCIEEGAELIHRLENGGPLPQFTSCCPGWLRFALLFYPELIPHISSVKSPQQVFGALLKTYYAKQSGIDPKKIFSVSVMPCVAKKWERQRKIGTHDSGYQDVDVVLTTRELIQMLRSAGINLAELPDEEFDNPMGYASGAGIVFGSGGGVLEGVMRTVYEKMTGKKLQTPAFKEVRTLEKIREAEIDIGGRVLKCATVRTTGETRRLIDKLKRGEAHYDFVEVMACPGGCVGGGGQPVYPGLDQWDQQLKQRYKRADALFEQDNLKKYRTAHDNPWIKKLYEEFLGEPHGEMSKKLIHTSYTEIPLYNLEGTASSVDQG